jgi:hypothetical protein
MEAYVVDKYTVARIFFAQSKGGVLMLLIGHPERSAVLICAAAANSAIF